jgi:hypothetical protein
MLRRFFSLFCPLFLIVALALVASCGSDDPAAPAQQTDTNVSGTVVKGPVASASVAIWTLGNDGNLGQLVVGDITTDQTGAWTAVIPASQTGTRFLVVATGGTYSEEVSGNAVEIPTDTPMVGFLYRSRPNAVAVTPFTHMMWLQTREIVASTGVTLAWERAISSASADNSFGFDPTTTLPSWSASAQVTQKAYAALLGALSGLPNSENDYASLSGANPYIRCLAIAEDAMDGVLDGIGTGGEPIQVPLENSGTVTMPSLSTTGIEALGQAAQSYASATEGLEDAAINGDMVVTPPTGGPDPTDCSNIGEIRAAARTSLENTLFATLNGPDPQVPDDVDFSAPRLLYQAVLECDPDDLDAHLALAILDLTVLSRDPEINDAFDHWDDYLDQMVPFETDPPSSQLSVPVGFINPRGAMELPLGAIERSLITYLNLEKVVAPPQIADVQDIFRNKLLPRVVTGIAHMDAVLDSPGFTFTISPRMQGDLLEEDREADYTDFLAIRAGMKALEAGVRIAISYDVNMDEYTGAELLAGLQQSSGYLATLQGDGTSQMQMVPDLLGGAADDLDAAIDALFAETDDQTDDLIKIGPSDIDGIELLEFQNEELAMMRETLDGPMTRAYDWDFNSFTPDQAMTVDMNAFFSSPVQNFKALLPPYTVSLETVPNQTTWSWGESPRSLSVNVPSPGNFYFSAQLSYYNFQLDWEDYSVPTWAENAVRTMFDNEIASIVSNNSWAGSLSLYCYFYGNLDAGLQDIQVYCDWSYSLADSWVEVAKVTFAADSYAQWLAQFPDPTLNGLFPGVSSALEWTEAFGIDQNNWSKEFSLDWTDSF